ncbi:RagB/SusD family nutrient uptake outer membrane protein [Flavivirga spongiicola]|uniref:RagB/SusD family nutrient uptake outer membrane protein n=1 Tax=Flavivirga spongiicola TaxID=421621 RepID=A0ABU7XYR7_9FLAO|nr:RagB/SusD family nutrient uptake outer membrane protein [Flavivirga sp. MEBiC05379]MDO5980935.1 RagB/SusD family nutrient uptake outer membrane protein [Flavivirga sp. MEBiC05379]
MKKILIITIVLFFATSCELTDVVENNPPNNLVPENVIQNENDAKALLNGVYTTITSRTSAFYYMYTELIPSTLIGSMSRVGFGTAAGQFATNTMTFDNTNVRDYWLIFYKVIDLSNNVITLTEAFPDSEFTGNNKSEIIGEAHFLRAMATFDALRYYGQFFDQNSSLGIVLRTEPSNFVNRSKARSTVAECYAQIISDLDKAIADAPDFSVSYRASKTSAKALKAKVLLFQGKYAEAAVLADEVINGGVTSLEADYESVFSKGLNSNEMILMAHRDENSDVDDNNRKRFYSGRAGTTWFSTLMETDPRKPFTFSGATVLKTNDADNFRPTYFLRLSEMYLIKAEALAMSGATLADASVPLNIVRNRAGIGDSPATTLDELKDDIFNEITRELAFENGSEWFAAIRLGKAMTLKPAITSSNQYILPIPEEEITGNGALTLADQNPGYESI